MLFEGPCHNTHTPALAAVDERQVAPFFVQPSPSLVKKPVSVNQCTWVYSEQNMTTRVACKLEPSIVVVEGSHLLRKVCERVNTGMISYRTHLDSVEG